MRERTGQAVMMTTHLAGPMPVLEHPLRVSGTGSLHKTLVSLDRRIARARRVCASQAVMMTILMHWEFSVAEQIPILEQESPATHCAWRDYSVEVPIYHTSATVCCIHDEDVRREVRLEMRRRLKGTWSNPGPANERGRNESDDSPGPSAAPLIL
jgi:hypothetical protein